MEKEIPGGSETILVVEDELALRELTCVLLQEAGYTVLESTGVEDAIATAKDSQRKDRPPLLTDIVMPRLDGRELASQLVALRPHLRVLYMSGYTDDVIVHRGSLKQANCSGPKTLYEGQAAAKSARNTGFPTCGFSQSS